LAVVLHSEKNRKKCQKMTFLEKAHLHGFIKSKNTKVPKNIPGQCARFQEKSDKKNKKIFNKFFKK